MVAKIKQNVINHLGPEANIHFDPIASQFVGQIDTLFGVERFTAQSISILLEGYEQAIERIMIRNQIFRDLITETSATEQQIQSGEGSIQLDPNETELNIGMKVKMLSNLADGAGFQMQEIST